MKMTGKKECDEYLWIIILAMVFRWKCVRYNSINRKSLSEATTRLKSPETTWQQVNIDRWKRKKELRQTGEKREQRSSHGLTRRKEDYTWLYQTRHVMSSTIQLMQQQRYQKLTSTLASLGGDPGWGSSGGESCPVLPRGPMASPPLMASGGEILAVDVAPSDSAPVGLDRPDAPVVALEGLLLLPPCAVSLLPLPVIPSRSSSSPVMPLLQTRQESAWKCVRMTMAWQTSEIDQFSSIPRVNRWMCWDVTCHGRWAKNLFRSLRSLNFLGAKSNPRSHLWSPS